MQRSVSLNQLIFAFSKALDLMDERLYTHHRNVAYISMRIAERLKKDDAFTQELVIAALLHDIGVFKCIDRKKLLAYNELETMGHEEIGALLFESNDILHEIANIIRYHHTPVNKKPENMPEASSIIYLADRISVMMNTKLSSVDQLNRIQSVIENDRGIRFDGRHIDAFYMCAETEAFWLDMKLGRQDIRIKDSLYKDTYMTSHDEIMKMGSLFIAAVDYRSRYTAAHSIGVSKVAKELSLAMGMTDKEADSMEIAGYYHDIGKIAIPKEVLDKPAALSLTEIEKIRCHSYFTYDILAQVDGLKDLAPIAAYHHECLDGSGYPFGKDKSDLSIECSIMAVADIFTAITEERPYRKQMDKKDAKDVIQYMIEKNKISKMIGELAIDIYDRLVVVNQENQAEIYKRFQMFEEIVYERTEVALS